MTVLIWILSAFVMVLLNEGLGMLIGFKLGYAILFFLISAIATALCKVVLGEDKKKKAKGKKSKKA